MKYFGRAHETKRAVVCVSRFFLFYQIMGGTFFGKLMKREVMRDFSVE